MRDNITKVAERGERLDQLQDKTGEFLPRLSTARASPDRVVRPCEKLLVFMHRRR